MGALPHHLIRQRPGRSNAERVILPHPGHIVAQQNEYHTDGAAHQQPGQLALLGQKAEHRCLGQPGNRRHQQRDGNDEALPQRAELLVVCAFGVHPGHNGKQRQAGQRQNRQNQHRPAGAVTVHRAVRPPMGGNDVGHLRVKVQVRRQVEQAHKAKNQIQPLIHLHDVPPFPGPPGPAPNRNRRTI